MTIKGNLHVLPLLMHTHVTFESTRVRETQITERANVWLLLGMDTHVCTEIAWLTESLVTYTALPRLEVMVHGFFMSYKHRPQWELLRTHWTNIGFFSGMTADMLQQLTGWAVLLWTIVTLERTIAGMKPEVKLQCRRVLEGHATLWADVWHGIWMCAFMVCTSALLCKSASAACTALKWSSTGVRAHVHI